MANPNRQEKPPTQRTVQNMVGWSFDNEYKVIAVENLVYNPDTGALDRMEQPGAAAEATTAYTTRSADHSETEGIKYFGEAEPGTATSAASWRIGRQDTSVAGATTFLYADGNSSYDNIWDNRESLSYI